MKQWDNTILGTLHLTVGQLRVDVNSTHRADRLAREVKRRLGAVAVLKTRSVEDLARRLDEIRAADERRVPVEEERPSELDELEDELYREHLESWIDTRVPALGHRTPSARSRTPRGRERLEALLAGIHEGHKGARPARQEALAAIRRALGLDDR